MAVAVRGTHTTDNGTGTGTTLTVDLSTAGAVAGDIAIIVAEFSVNGGTLSLNRADYVNGGLVNLSTTFTGQSWAKVLTAGDITDDTVQITCSGSGRAAPGCTDSQIHSAMQARKSSTMMPAALTSARR